jgi:hypothetical protein
MSDLSKTPDGNESLLAHFQSLSTEDLKRSLVLQLEMSANTLLHTAYLVRVLEERGEDLSGLKIGLIHHLRKIACGQLLPEVVVRFAGKPSLIALIGNLPLAEQRRLADGEHVRLVVYDQATGQRTHRMADPLALTPRQVAQVFARDHVRRDDEQALLLDERRERAAQPVPETVGKLKLDRERGVAILGNHVIPLADLELAVKLLKRRQ